MKKFVYAALFGLGVLGVTLLHAGEMLGIGPEEILRGNDVMTNVYVGTRAADLQLYNSVTLRIKVASGTSAATFSIKPQWTDDTHFSTTNWIDESVLVAGATSAGEQVYTNLSRVIQVPSTNGTYIERYNRLARHFRVSVKSSVASPEWSSLKGVQITVTPLNQ